MIQTKVVLLRQLLCSCDNYLGQTTNLLIVAIFYFFCAPEAG